MKYSILFFIILTSCTTTIKMEEKLQARIGQNINEVIQQMGPPTRTFKMPNGSTMYTWHNEGVMTTSAKTKAWSLTGEKELITNTSYCDITYTANQKDEITSWNHAGDSCRSK